MKEFMFYIRNVGDAKASLSPEEHLSFVKKCETYINRLKAENKLIAAQPLIREGVILSRPDNNWASSPVDSTNQIQVGYYHIRAASLDEAIELAKENPEFEFVPSASIEVRPVKMIEQQTNFVYPKGD